MEFDTTQEQHNSINKSLAELQSLWVTEVHAPEILDYQKKLVDEIREQLDAQQNSLNSRIEEGQDAFFTTMYQMDIERVRYSLSRYLRCRIMKIEDSLEYMMDHFDVLERLSIEEQQFATKLFNLLNTHTTATVVSRLSSDLQELAVQYRSNGYLNARPQIKDFVFCRPKEDISGIDVGDDVVVDLRQGEIQMIQYSAIQEYVRNGSVQLI